jgi:hypothetical protein
VTLDLAEAARWYERAAAQGQVEAQFNLGVLHEEGAGVAQSHVRAAYWYRLAAYRGHAKAQFNLAILYASGRGVPLDGVNAYAWYDAAAGNGNAKARFNRDLLAESLTPEQLLAARQLAADFAKRYRSRPES